MVYSENFAALSDDEMMEVDGGFAWAAVWGAVKIGAVVGAVGLAGVVVGAGAVIGVYYTCKWMFG